MGCDIHLHTEIKVNGKWLHYSQPEIRRNYEIFGWLGCDRGEKIIFPEKGIPEDITETTKLCLEYNTKQFTPHHKSYLTWQELDKFEDKLTEEYDMFHHDQLGYLFGSSWRSPKEANPPAFLEDVRFVYWFDN